MKTVIMGGRGQCPVKIRDHLNSIHYDRCFTKVLVCDVAQAVYRWVQENGITVEKFPLDSKYGPYAIAIRNQGIIKCKPGLIVSFRNCEGGQALLDLALDAGIEVIQICKLKKSKKHKR